MRNIYTHRHTHAYVEVYIRCFAVVLPTVLFFCLPSAFNFLSFWLNNFNVPGLGSVVIKLAFIS